MLRPPLLASWRRGKPARIAAAFAPPQHGWTAGRKNGCCSGKIALDALEFSEGLKVRVHHAEFRIAIRVSSASHPSCAPRIAAGAITNGARTEAEFLPSSACGWPPERR